MTGRRVVQAVGLLGCWLGLAALARGDERTTGFQAEVVIRKATRLDWTFAAASLAPDAARVPDDYDSGKQRYQLYVPAAYRGRGVGKVLMQAVFEVAARHGCSRVEWTTDVTNAGAQAFYDRLGLARYPSKVFYRVEIVHLPARLAAPVPGSDHLKRPRHPGGHELSAPGGRYA